MTNDNIKAAQKIAREFLKASDEALKEKDKSDFWGSGTKRSSALRRVSMDLTRALAEMRRP